MEPTKTKAPPKKTAGEIAALFSKCEVKPKSGYLTKLTSLFSFLQLTANIRTAVEVLETGLYISVDGSIIEPECVRQRVIDDRLSRQAFLIEEEGELRIQSRALWEEKDKCHTIIRRKNTDEKKEKARLKLEELEKEGERLNAERNELTTRQNEMKAAARSELEAIDFTPKEMRDQLKLLEGVKIQVVLETGTYAFPVPDGAFYRQVCLLLGLSLAEPEPEAVVERTFTFPREALEAIRKAVLFVSTDDLRPAMTCVSIDIKKNKLLVVATDAHRLYKSRAFDITGPKGDWNYLLPATALKRLPKARKGDFDLCELKGGKVGLLGLTVDLMDARYPDWRVVVPEYKMGVSFNREAFIRNVSQVLPFSNKSTWQVNLDINGAIRLAAQDIDFSFESGVKMDYKKKSMPDTIIGFNGRFLIEVMKVFKSENITMLSEGSPTKAGIFTDGVDEVLVMPLMINC